jgi:hypothetical protein
MRQISEHEFLRGDKNELTLLLDVISFEAPVEPALLVSKLESKAYLRRAPGDLFEILAINDKMIADVRAAEAVVILELTGDKVTHGYDVPTAIFEDVETA